MLMPLLRSGSMHPLCAQHCVCDGVHAFGKNEKKNESGSVHCVYCSGDNGGGMHLAREKKERKCVRLLRVQQQERRRFWRLASI
jgi:hypothetical protein